MTNPAQTAAGTKVLAYALLDRQFKAAKVAAEGSTMPRGPRPMKAFGLLAWCDVENGQPDAAAPLLARTPVPPSARVTTFMPLWFPRIFELRAMVAEKAGKADEAKQNRDLFGKLSAR